MDEREETMDGVVIPPRYGSVSLIGRRRVMKDAITVAPQGLPFGYECFAVYTDQGGPKVANLCRARLHRILAEEIVSHGAGDETGGRMSVDFNWSWLMKASFLKLDDEVSKFMGRNRGRGEDDWLDGAASETESTGAIVTVVVVVVSEDEIVVANCVCGDSRAVLFRSGAALQLSRHHEPDSSTDGQVRIQAPIRVSSGDTPISRAIGDHNHTMKPCLSAEPEVQVFARAQSDEFLIIATHGLWDVVSNEDACKVVKNSLDGQIRRSLEENLVTSPAVAATTLAELALARGSKDNISLIVAEL